MPPLPGLLTPLGEVEERRPSAFFILLAAAEVRERRSEVEEVGDAGVAAPDADYGM